MWQSRKITIHARRVHSPNRQLIILAMCDFVKLNFFSMQNFVHVRFNLACLLACLSVLMPSFTCVVLVVTYEDFFSSFCVAGSLSVSLSLSFSLSVCLSLSLSVCLSSFLSIKVWAKLSKLGECRPFYMWSI